METHDALLSKGIVTRAARAVVFLRVRPLKRDVARIRAIRDELQAVEPKRTVLERVLPEIGELIGTMKTIAYTVMPTATHLQLDQGLGRAFKDVPAARRQFQALLSSAPIRFAGYDPLRPEPTQRNVALDVVRWRGWDAFRELPLYQRVNIPQDLGNHDQLRVLVCEGQTLLAYVGGYRHDHLFSDYERQLLQAITPDLRRALLLERQMRDAPRHESALAAALEAVSGEAYVLDRVGRVSHANAAARARLEQDRRAICELLQSALKANLPGFELSRLAEGGTLVVRRGAGEREARVAAARERYALTPRQAEVLLELACGKSNAEISAALGCSLPTVESHFRALFAKLECESRAALLAKLLE